MNPPKRGAQNPTLAKPPMLEYKMQNKPRNKTFRAEGPLHDLSKDKQFSLNLFFTFSLPSFLWFIVKINFDI